MATKKYEQKTRPSTRSVEDFVKAIGDPKRRKDCATLVELMKKASKSEPKMWGPSIVGFGMYHYRYASGHEGDSCILGFASRKDALTLYLSGGVDAHREILGRLGKYKTGKGCLYIKSLDDVDLSVLKELLTKAEKPPKPSATSSSS